MTEIYDQLMKMRNGGWGHYDLIKKAQEITTDGYDISDDESVMLLGFKDGYIVISHGSVHVYPFA